MDNTWKGLTLLVAFSVAWIGWQQWRLSREKLRLDLFDRRHAIFEAARAFIAGIAASGKVETAAEFKFLAGTADATFLFHVEVKTYLDLVFQQAVQLHMHERMQEGDAPDRHRHIDEEAKLHTWFAEQLTDSGLPTVFARYLKFQDLH